MIRDLENNLISLQNEANAHRLILGKSGYGKTWFCYRMLEESVEQKKNSLVFDYSGSFTENELVCCLIDFQLNNAECFFIDKATERGDAVASLSEVNAVRWENRQVI